jgi:hypothetical protein
VGRTLTQSSFAMTFASDALSRAPAARRGARGRARPARARRLDLDARGSRDLLLADVFVERAAGAALDDDFVVERLGVTVRRRGSSSSAREAYRQASRITCSSPAPSFRARVTARSA